MPRNMDQNPRPSAQPEPQGQLSHAEQEDARQQALMKLNAIKDKINKTVVVRPRKEDHH